MVPARHLPAAPVHASGDICVRHSFEQCWALTPVQLLASRKKRGKKEEKSGDQDRRVEDGSEDGNPLFDDDSAGGHENDGAAWGEPPAPRKREEDVDEDDMTSDGVQSYKRPDAAEEREWEEGGEAKARELLEELQNATEVPSCRLSLGFGV